LSKSLLLIVSAVGVAVLFADLSIRVNPKEIDAAIAMVMIIFFMVIIKIIEGRIIRSKSAYKG